MEKQDEFWDIFLKTGEVGAYLDYRRQRAGRGYFADYNIWEEDEGKRDAGF